MTSHQFCLPRQNALRLSCVCPSRTLFASNLEQLRLKELGQTSGDRGFFVATARFDVQRKVAINFFFCSTVSTGFAAKTDLQSQAKVIRRQRWLFGFLRLIGPRKLAVSSRCVHCSLGCVCTRWVSIQTLRWNLLSLFQFFVDRIDQIAQESRSIRNDK